MERSIRYQSDRLAAHMQLPAESRALREAMWRRAGKRPPWERHYDTNARRRRLLLLTEYS